VTVKSKVAIGATETGVTVKQAVVGGGVPAVLEALLLQPHLFPHLLLAPLDTVTGKI